MNPPPPAENETRAAVFPLRPFERFHDDSMMANVEFQKVNCN